MSYGQNKFVPDFPLYFRIFSFIKKSDILTRQNFIFEQKIIFTFNFYYKKGPKKHSAYLKIQKNNFMICPNGYSWLKFQEYKELSLPLKIIDNK